MEGQAEGAKEFRTPEEFLAFAKAEGIELTDEQLETVAGGSGKSWDGKRTCPSCGSSNTAAFGNYDSNGIFIVHYCQCYACGHQWWPPAFAPAEEA